MKKIREDGREWRRRLKEILETYRPTIVRCSNYGSPRHYSYICRYCGKE